MPPPLTSRIHAAPRSHFWSALGVALATVGCAPPGPRAAPDAVEALRMTVRVVPPQNVPSSVTRELTLSVLRSGDPRGPRLILVHGTPGSAAAWADYLLTPPPGLELVAIDRPGFGRSGPEHALPSLADQAAAVRAVLPDDGRPVLLLGHSLGGPVVARVAADDPLRIAAVVLLAASLSPELETIHPMQRVGAWAPVRGLLPRAIRNANAELMALKPELQALAPDLARITAPVVIVHGTDDDLVPPANVPYLQARLTGSRCVQTVMLPGRNHFLPWNSEAEVRAAIRRALEAAC